MPEAHSSHKRSVAQSQHGARRQLSSGCKHSMCVPPRGQESAHGTRGPTSGGRLPRAGSQPHGVGHVRDEPRMGPVAGPPPQLSPNCNRVCKMCATNPQHSACVLACCHCGVAAFMRDQFDMVLWGRSPGSAAVAAGAVAEGDVRHVVDEERVPRLPVRVLYGVPRPRGPQALLLEPSDVATCVAT